MRANFKAFDPSIDTKEPSCATSLSVGYDCFVPKQTLLPAGQITIVPLNLVWAPDRPVMAKLLEKGGLSTKNIHILAGVIEADYKDEWKAVVYNASKVDVVIPEHKAICQVVFSDVIKPIDLEVKQVARNGGFDSTRS